MPAIICIALTVLFALPAEAHEMNKASGFLSGLQHPVAGVAHILGMLGVGIVCAQLGKAALRNGLAAFAVMLLVGGALKAFGVALFYTAYLLPVSLLVLGGLVALAKNAPEWSVLAVVAVFGAFYGYVNNWMPMELSHLGYGAGFLLGTALMYAAGGFVAGVVNQLRKGPVLLRFAGAVVAGMGLQMILGL